MIQLRPHHGLCLQFFVGKGYGDSFVKHMAELQEYLAQNAEEKIHLVKGVDCVCANCPHNLSGVCASADKVQRYDERCLEGTARTAGEILSWSDFQKTLKKNIMVWNKLPQICGDCQWYSICEQRQKEILGSDHFNV